MTLYGLVIGEISAIIKGNSSVDRNFIVDIPTSGDGDLYSNAPKVFGSEFVFSENISCVASVSLDNGFLNFRLKDEILSDFLGQFELTENEIEDEFQKKLSAYIQLAENERKLAGELSGSFEFTPEVRRAVLLLMKLQYISDSDAKKSRIVWNEIVRILTKLESDSENLKSFVIIYEPLLIAVRGSLAKFTA